MAILNQHLSDKNLALDLVRVTEAAALAAARYHGRGDKEEADGAAVAAMRIAFQSVHIKGHVMIGEGEKDKAPMLYHGEQVGFGDGAEVDIAVDPIEGTNAVAYGRPNAIAVVGAVDKGHMYNPGHSFYCKKLVVGADAADCDLDIDAPIKDNLQRIAHAKGKSMADLNVFVLDKPRHQGLIQELRLAGVRVYMQPDGDVAGALMASDPRHYMDVLVGIGGTPEAVITACALKGSGAKMLVKLNPLSDSERQSIIDDGVDLERVLTVDDIITTDKCYFAATGISSGDILHGVEYRGDYACTSSMTTRGRTGTIRYIQAWHNRKKLSGMSSVNY